MEINIFQFCRRVWTEFMQWQVLSGAVPAAAFADPSQGLRSAKWLAPSWPWVDPLKDANAAILEMNANLRSRSEVIAERGYDAEEVDAEIAADHARALRFGIDSKPSAASGEAQDADKEDSNVV